MHGLDDLRAGLHELGTPHGARDVVPGGLEQSALFRRRAVSRIIQQAEERSGIGKVGAGGRSVERHTASV